MQRYRTGKFKFWNACRSLNLTIKMNLHIHYNIDFMFLLHAYKFNMSAFTWINCRVPFEKISFCSFIFLRCYKLSKITLLWINIICRLCYCNSIYMFVFVFRYFTFTIEFQVITYLSNTENLTTYFLLFRFNEMFDKLVYDNRQYDLWHIPDIWHNMIY